MRTAPGAPAAALAVLALCAASDTWAGADGLPGLSPGRPLEWVHDARGGHPPLSAPALAHLPDGTPLLAWTAIEEGAAEVRVLAAGRQGAAPVRVNPPGLAADSIHQPPGLAVAPDGAVFATWPSARTKPAGVLSASDLRLSRSGDGGRSFEPPLRLNAEQSPVSFGFENLAIAGDGSPVVAWIDGHDGRAATFVARVAPDARRVLATARLGEDTCVCCRADVAARDRRVAVLWRANFPGDVRDMVLASSSDGGASFGPASPVHRDGWVMSGCPHRGGSAVIDAQGRVIAAWYTEGTRRRPELRLATSTDGLSFGAPQRLDESDGAIPDHLRIAIDAAGRILTTWEEATAVRRGVVARLSTDGGRSFSPPVVLSAAMKAGNPTVAAAPGGGFSVAWREEQFPVTKTVVLPLRPVGRAPGTGPGAAPGAGSPPGA